MNTSFENLSMDDLKSVMVKIYKGTNQQEVAQATEFLWAYSSTLPSVPAFVQILTQDQANELRLLAAILLKKFIAPHLTAMGAEDRQLLQNSILERFFVEPLKRVQRSLASLISVMMKESFKIESNWTDPLIIVSQKTQPDQSQEVRTQGFLLLTTILEVTGEHLQSFYENLFKFFMDTLKDNSPAIRKQTLLCVLNMYVSVEDKDLIKSFGLIYDSLLQCFYECLKENDEDIIEKALESICALTQRKNNLFDNNKLNKLIELFCTPEGLMSKELNPLFRETMIDVILKVILSYKTIVSKSEVMLRKIVEIIFTLACVKEAKEDVQDRDPISEVALSFVNQVAIYLPKKKSYPIYKDYLMKMFASENTEVVEGAFYIISELAEGCTEYIRRDLPTIMKNFIQKGLESTNEDIIRAAFYTIRLFASYISADMIVYHPMILPALIKYLNSSDQKILISNVISLDIFCKEMTESIMDYIPDLIPKLIDLVDKPENEILVKSHAVLAISSCAQVAEDKFAPYAAKILPLLAHLVNMTDKQYIQIKASAIKCAGIIVGNCIASTPEVFSSLVEPLIPTVYDAIKSSENTQLKEYSFEFFYNLAGFLKEGFRPYVERIVDLVFETIQRVQALQKQERPKVISLDSDSEDENDPNYVWVDENAIEEMSAAIDCLGEMAVACPGEFSPYYEKTVTIIAELSKFFHSTIRTQALWCFKNVAFAIVKLGNNGTIPKYTRGLPCSQRFSPDAEKFLYEDVYAKLMYTLEMDENIEVLITVTEILQEFCMELGPASVDQKLDDIVHYIIKIFSNETNAQNQVYDDEEEEVHSELFASTTLLVDLLIKCCRDGFVGQFDKLYPHLKKFAVGEEFAEDDVSEIIGTFAQAAKYMPAAIPIYGLDMLEVCIKALEYGDEYINNNIAYCMGLVVENGKEKIYDHYRTIMEKLRVIFENSTIPDTRDNAVSSLARLVYTNPNIVPLNVVVPHLVGELPLKGDPKENRSCIKMLVFLLETSPQTLSGLEAKAIQLLIDAVVERKKYKIKDENMIKAIGNILKNLSNNENGKQLIQESASKLSQENVEILTQLLTTEY